MIVEHTFVTTLDSHEAVAAAAGFLNRHGFIAEVQTAFELDRGPLSTLTMWRCSNIRAKTAADCPQKIVLECDRRRMNITATIVPWVQKRRGVPVASNPKSYESGATITTAQWRDFARLIFSIMYALQILLVNRMPAEIAERKWIAVEEAMQQRRIRSRALGYVNRMGGMILIGIYVWAILQLFL